ncbi:uncharacterized protein BDV14DRAFT_184746 [Aspergillus stella-maris]|uniref:uncharacterized protein n=1 Tax=Aspergillus stella-maris TaxID=1810926 RepID=UPI003CCD44AF
MSVPQPTQFINSVLAQLSRLTSSPPAASAGANEQDDFETPTQTQRQTQRPRPGQTQTQSAFPSAQLTSLKPLMLTLHCIFPNEFLLALDILDRGLVRRVNIHEGGDEDADKEQDDLESTAGTQIEGSTTPMGTRKEDFFFVTSASMIPTSSSSKPKTPSSRSLYPTSQAVSGPEELRNGIQSRKDKQWQEKGYEVRLQAWNCTCPPFTLSAFRDLGPEPLPSSPPSSDTLSRSSSPESSPVHGQTHPEKTGDHSSPKHDHRTAEADTSSPTTDSNTPAYTFGGTLPLHAVSAPPVCKHILACLLVAICPRLGSGSEGGESEIEGGLTGGFVRLEREEVAALCAAWGG